MGMIRSDIEGRRIDWKVCSVYAEGWNNMEEKLDKILGEEEIGRKEESIIVGGDFNVRIGELEDTEIEGNGMERKSKDKTIGNGGRRLIDLVKERG